MTTDAAAIGSARPHLDGIESLRGYAACAIIVFHVIHLAGVATPGSLSFIGGFFGFAVPLFFVVSAFSLAYGYQGRLGTGAQVGRFYLRRLFRIAPLYYAMLAFTVLAYRPGSWIGAHPGELAANLTFAFNLFPALVDGIAPASWSIGVEMLFYAILPPILLLVRGVVSAALATVAAIGLAVAFGVQMDAQGDIPGGFIQHGFLFNLPYFGFGLLGYFLYRRASSRLAGGALIAAGLGLVILYLMTLVSPPLMPGRAGNTVYQALWGGPFALLCLAMAWRPPLLLSNVVTQFLGKISFSLYLAHPHIIAALNGMGAYRNIESLPGGSGVRFPVSILLTLAVAIPLSWGLYKLIEEPGMALGRSRRGGKPLALAQAQSEA